MTDHLARRMWTVTEPYHAVVYFAPEMRVAYDAAGLKGGWMGYFASRGAAMGAVSASVIAATFYNFHPKMVCRAIPDAWSFASPGKVLEARLSGVDAALRRLLSDAVDGEPLREAAALARRASEACTSGGRPLYAAHADLPWPEAPHLELWQACTLLREFRGDGHVSSLLTSRLDGCEANVAMSAGGDVPRALLAPFRGWSDEDWDAAAARLEGRGWLDDQGCLTKEGATERALLERRTDELASAPWNHLGEDGCDRLHALMLDILEPIASAQGLPYPNPIGVPAPT
ncbi:MAG: hypothetical protein M3343_09210 [Actinomycetota bacterium]|nr:hypothetical protein [Actinomycetota bacterium]